MSEETTEGQAEKWFLAEGVQGEGERPEWHLSKFASISDQAKATTHYHSEMDKAKNEIKALKKDIEEKYAVWTTEGEPEIPEEWSKTYHNFKIDSPAGREFCDWVKSNKIAPDYASTMLHMLNKAAGEYVVHHDDEVKKLGDMGNETVGRLNQWLTNTLQPDARDSVRESISRLPADVIKALDTIRQGAKSSHASSYEANMASPRPTIAAVRAEMAKNKDRLLSDPEYRQSVLNKLKEAQP